MNVVIGSISIVLGVVYLTLAMLAGWEMFTSRKLYGVSRFGLGYILMAISCGPHHLLHGSHVLHGDDYSAAVAAVTLMGLVPGLIFVGLRVEAMLGGRGDRFIEGTPTWLIVVPQVGLVSGGFVVAVSLGSADLTDKTGSVLFWSNLFVVITYAMVAWPLVLTQFRRRPEAGGWSVAGLAVAGIFPTCALMHLVYAFEATGDIHTTITAVVGVPASVYFLWVVHALHSESIVDWNSQPVAGRRMLPPRTAPWDQTQESAPTG